MSRTSRRASSALRSPSGTAKPIRRAQTPKLTIGVPMLSETVRAGCCAHAMHRSSPRPKVRSRRCWSECGEHNRPFRDKVYSRPHQAKLRVLAKHLLDGSDPGRQTEALE